MTSSLAGHTGRWVGSNDFRLLPTDTPARAPMTLEVIVAADGRLASVRYTWSHPDDGEQDGLLTVGPSEDGESGGAVALWGDSWHQAPAARELGGSTSADGFVVGYTYSDDGWRWEITVLAPDADRLLLRMDNLGPPGEVGRYGAMNAELRRSDDVGTP